MKVLTSARLALVGKGIVRFVFAPDFTQVIHIPQVIDTVSRPLYNMDYVVEQLYQSN